MNPPPKRFVGFNQQHNNLTPRLQLPFFFGEVDVRLSLMGRVPSPSVDESGHSRSQRFNVGNLRDTGHLAEATPPAAMADKQPLGGDRLNGRNG